MGNNIFLNRKVTEPSSQPSNPSDSFKSPSTQIPNDTASVIEILEQIEELLKTNKRSEAFELAGLNLPYNINVETVLLLALNNDCIETIKFLFPSKQDKEKYYEQHPNEREFAFFKRLDHIQNVDELNYVKSEGTVYNLDDHFIIQCSTKHDKELLNWVLGHDRVTWTDTTINACVKSFLLYMKAPNSDEFLEILWNIPQVKKAIFLCLDINWTVEDILHYVIKRKNEKWVGRLLESLIYYEQVCTNTVVRASSSTPAILNLVLSHIKLVDECSYGYGGLWIDNVLCNLVDPEIFHVLVKHRFVDVLLKKTKDHVECLLGRCNFVTLQLLLSNQQILYALTYDINKWKGEFIKNGQIQLADILIECFDSVKFKKYRQFHNISPDKPEESLVNLM